MITTKAFKLFVFVLLAVISVASGLSADQTYYKEHTDYFNPFVVLTKCEPLSSSVINMSGAELLYHFDESSGNITDYSGNDRVGVVAGSPTYNVPSSCNVGLKLNDYTDYVVAENSDSLDLVDNSTISVWFRADSFACGSYGYCPILYKRFNVAVKLTTSGEVGVYSWVSSSDILSGTYVNTGELHNLIVRLTNGTILDLFLDGNLILHYNTSSPFQPSAYDVKLGAHEVNPSNAHFIGTIDELIFFSRALSDSEVQKIYSSGGEYVTASLVSDCGEVVDWDGDHVLDLVGFKTNISDSSVLWSIYRNIGTNTNPSYQHIYDFTKDIRGNKNFGGSCVAVADLDDDGKKEVLTYNPTIPDTDSSSAYDDDYNKTGYRSMWENEGTALNPVFVFSGNVKIQLPVGYSANDNLASSPYDTLYHYVVGRLPTAMYLLGTLCYSCSGHVCSTSTGCYGFSSWSPNPKVWYQFFDVDYDGDLDLFVSSENDRSYWWLNNGTTKSPHFVFAGDSLFSYRAWTQIDHVRVVDFDSDGDPDYLGTPINSIASNIRYFLVTSDGWTDPQKREQIINRTPDFSAPFDNSNTYEPNGFGYSSRPVYVGNLDLDGDADILAVENTGSGLRMVWYESQGVGDTTGYNPESLTCEFPCILDEDFSGYPDGTKVNDIPRWSADDCVLIENNELVIRGNCTTNRVCVDLKSDITSVGTIKFEVEVDSGISKYSSYYSGFDQLSVLNAWDSDYTSFYNYIGDFLSRELLSNFTTGVYSTYLSVVNVTAENFTLFYSDFDGGRPFYDGSTTITGINRLCWNVDTTDGLMKIDNILVYAGTNLLRDTTGDYEASGDYDCYAGWCYKKKGLLGDARPAHYIPKPDIIAGLYFDYDRCISEGYAPNQLCIIKLAWKDGSDSIRRWFVSNIVPIFLMLLLLLSVAVVLVRRSY